MPLVVPGINDNSSDSPDSLTQQWMTKLMGKTISDKGPTNETNFAKTELPKNTRVLGEGDMATMDFQKDRMNVHLDKDGTVRKVTHG